MVLWAWRVEVWVQVWAWASFFWEEEVDSCSWTVLFLEVGESISLGLRKVVWLLQGLLKVHET